jgi:hypothetical protein
MICKFSRFLLHPVYRMYVYLTLPVRIPANSLVFKNRTLMVSYRLNVWYYYSHFLACALRKLVPSNEWNVLFYTAFHEFGCQRLVSSKNEFNRILVCAHSFTKSHKITNIQVRASCNDIWVIFFSILSIRGSLVKENIQNYQRKL